MKYYFSQVMLILLLLMSVSSCASTSSKEFACDFIQGTKNNIEIKDGRDKHGKTSQVDKSNLHFDLSFGFISATVKAIKRGFTTKEKSKQKKCV